MTHLELPVQTVRLLVLSLVLVLTGTAHAADLVRRPVAAPSAPSEPVASAPSVPHASERAHGELAAADICRGLDMQMGRVRACYERALKSAPALRGRLVVSFSISADGSVGPRAVARDELGRQDVADCVLDAVSELRFRASRSGADVEYPFLFRPQS
jgi:hypothetical protein